MNDKRPDIDLMLYLPAAIMLVILATVWGYQSYYHVKQEIPEQLKIDAPAPSLNYVPPGD